MLIQQSYYNKQDCFLKVRDEIFQMRLYKLLEQT